MEEEEEKAALSRREQRKLKLMEYLAAKGRLKVPNPRPYLRENQPKTQSITSPPVVNGKENKGSQKAVSSVGLKASESKPDPVRKVLSVSRVDVRGSTATSQKKTNIPVLTGTIRHSQNPELTRSAAAVSSRSSLHPAAGVKKQPSAGVQTSVRAAPKASHTLPSKPNSKFNLSSKTACPTASWTSSRVSLGPLTKTRTGLTPTVPQPRINKPNGLQPSNTSSAVPANKAASRRTLPGSVSHSVMAVRAQQPHCKPQLGKLPQPPGEKQLWRGFKPSCAPSAPQPAGSSTKPRSAAEGQKPASHTSSKPAARAGFRAPNGRPQAATAAAELGRKLKMSRGTDGKMQNRSATVRTGAPAVSQTVPQPVRTISLTGHTANTKTPKLTVKHIPHTEKKKVTAAQEERMWKLQEWRQAKGISYKRPSMPVPSSVSRQTTAVSQPFWKSMKEEDEVQSLVCAVDHTLADCVKLLEEGCPPDQVSGVLSRLPPVSRKFTKYWICRARLMERQGNLDVLPMFKEAVRVVVEPLDELRTVVFEILKRKNEIQAESDGEPTAWCEHSPDPGPQSAVTPKLVRALIWGQNGDSSVIKYKITATPGGPPSQKRESTRINGQEVRFFTPVRRSVRIESHSRRYPAALQDHDPCVASYDDLFAEEEGPDKEAEPSEEGGEAPLYIYRENQALEEKVLVQLVCDDSS